MQKNENKNMQNYAKICNGKCASNIQIHADEYMQEYVLICSPLLCKYMQDICKYVQYMLIYAMENICRNMQIKICRNMQYICNIYAISSFQFWASADLRFITSLKLLFLLLLLLLLKNVLQGFAFALEPLPMLPRWFEWATKNQLLTY